jgi:uracil-DNA glycosylase family 4
MDPTRSVTPEERRRALDVIAAEVAVCTRCPLHATRTMAVPGEGHPETEVVFVGEGPGYNEDQQGRPFVGAAGSLLNELLRQIGWKRQEVFITNVVKCRPPSNRDPEPNEIAACEPFLKRQLEILDPAVVVTLGRHSLQTFNAGARIGGAHGTLQPVDPATGAPNALTYAMYHPAAALRQGSLKQTMLEDMCGLPDALIESRRRRQPAQSPDVAPFEAIEPVPEPVVEEAVVLEIEPELVAIAIAQDSLADPIEVDENQMSLF